MDDLSPLLNDADGDLPRSLFGYRIRTVERHIRHLLTVEESRTRPWSKQMQRLAVDVTRNNERRKTLEDLAAHFQTECDRLRQQIEREKVTSRYAAEGVRLEIERMEAEFHSRSDLIARDRERADAEIQHAEQVLWQLSEHLTRVLQEAQTLADQHLSPKTAETVFNEFAAAVLGSAFVAPAPELMASGLLACFELPTDRVQATTRQGDPLGPVAAVLISTVQPAIVAHVVPTVGAIVAEDVQVMRSQNIMVRQHFQPVSLEMIVQTYNRAMQGQPSGATTDQGRRPDTAMEASLPVDESRGGERRDPAEREPMPNEFAGHAPDSTPDAEADLTERGVTPPLDAITGTEEPNNSPTGNVRSSEEEPLHADPIPTPLELVTETSWENVSTELDTDPTSATPPDADNDTLAAPDASLGTGLSARHSTSASAGLELNLPSWHEDAAIEAHPTESGLGLPGIHEATPPRLPPRPDRPLSAGVFDLEPLPGMDTAREPGLPSPSWSDAGLTPVPQPPIVPQPLLSPEDREGTPVGSVADAGESGGLDVRTFLYGKRVGQDIKDSRQNVVARSGDLITPELVQRVEASGLLPDLIVHMVF